MPCSFFVSWAKYGRIGEVSLCIIQEERENR